MDAKFLNNWSTEGSRGSGGLGGVLSDFDIADDALEGANVLLASYGTPFYEGYAFVLFERDGKLFEVNGSHCSCYGLEGQWKPEETSLPELRHRLDEGQLGAGIYDDNPFAAELREVLDEFAAPPSRSQG